MRIVNIDPQSDAALSLLREAAVDVRPLHGEALGLPWPRNLPLGPRDVYVAAFVGGTAIGCGAIRGLNASTRCGYREKSPIRCLGESVNVAPLYEITLESKR
jgi:hypothetical protein